jgi:XTP/dITP diphosphohydrolase
MNSPFKNAKNEKLRGDKMTKLIFVTGNKEKIAIANMALRNTKFQIEPRKIYCEEVQSDDIEDIASKSALFASKALNLELVKVDSGLFIEALNGFPGPYSAFVEGRLDAKLILKMMEGEANRSAFYKEALAYCKPGEIPIVFSALTRGHISLRASGKLGWNFDRIFIADGDTKTMAHFDDEERVSKYNNENWKRLILYLGRNRAK